MRMGGMVTIVSRPVLSELGDLSVLHFLNRSFFGTYLLYPTILDIPHHFGFLKVKLKSTLKNRNHLFIKNLFKINPLIMVHELILFNNLENAKEVIDKIWF